MYKKILTNNDCYKANRQITPVGIMVHSTGANNPNLKRYVVLDGVTGANTNNNDWDRPGLSACVHAFIGKDKDGNVTTIQTLPWNWRGWHCKKSGNDTHISFEICEDGLNDPVYFKACYDEAVKLCAQLCSEFGIDPGNIICHSEGYTQGIASNHADVMHWFPKHGKTMADFRSDVRAYNQKTLYRVQCGAFSIKDNAVRLRDTLVKEGYDAFIVEVK